MGNFLAPKMPAPIIQAAPAPTVLPTPDPTAANRDAQIAQQQADTTGVSRDKTELTVSRLGDVAKAVRRTGMTGAPAKTAAPAPTIVA